MPYRMPERSTFAERAERARKASGGIDSAIARRVRFEANREWLRKVDERNRFDSFLLADEILDAALRLRDDNRPVSADDPWNGAFCSALTLVRQARELYARSAILCTSAKQL